MKRTNANSAKGKTIPKTLPSRSSPRSPGATGKEGMFPGHFIRASLCGDNHGQEDYNASRLETSWEEVAGGRLTKPNLTDSLLLHTCPLPQEAKNGKAE
jgi:hypothetical protein